MEEKITLKEIKELGGPQALLKKEWSPCQYACPVHADIRGYLDLISRGKFKEALEVIREVLPFPSVCGRICHHPCEKECRRQDVDKALAIRDLKRFVAEWDYREKRARKKIKQTKGRIAIVGGGPSGLTAALDLARMGYQPTIFERSDLLGGMLVSAIPTYRLPRDLIEKDIEEIVSYGIEVKKGLEIGKDISLLELFNRGFKAVHLAVGLRESRSLPFYPLPREGEGKGCEAGLQRRRGEGDNLKVMLALPFLEAAAFNKKISLGKEVLVIGGGNVAMDVARTAVRLGVPKVKVVCLESKREMPAWEWEIEEAREEGVELIYSRGPKRILSSGDTITGLEVMEVQSVFDKDGRFNPQFYEDKVSAISADTIIIAIGQKANLAFLEGTGIKIERGLPHYAPETLMTDREGVFVSGEVALGPASLVESVASGHRAASAIDAFLSGKDIRIPVLEKPKIDKLPLDIKDKVIVKERVAMPTLKAEERRHDFRQFELGFSLKDALEESRRCLSCGAGAVCVSDRCVACLTCYRVCPFKVPHVTDVASMSSDRCLGCGLCAPECPTKAIMMKGYLVEETKMKIKEGLKALTGKQKIVLLTCGYRLYRIADFNLSEVAEVIVPAMSQLWTSDILYSFEQGASAVLIAECNEGECRYPEATPRLKKKVEEAQDLLGEIGIPRERVVLKFGLTALDDNLKREIAEIVKGGNDEKT